MTRTTLELDSETVERLKGKKIIPQESYDELLTRMNGHLKNDFARKKA